MTKEEILNNICYYDKRHPDGAHASGCFDEDELEACSNKDTCYCDNCFYGRTKLAEYILKLLENGKQS